VASHPGRESGESVKAIILARGLGTRMRKEDEAASVDDRQSAIADTGVKAMIPIDRPFLDYVLSVLAESGYREVCLVIGPEHTELRKYYEKLDTMLLNLSFAIQEKPLGTGDAVAAAEKFTGRDHFLMINSDNYYPVEACRDLRLLDESGLAVFERDAMIAQSNIPADRVVKFAAVEIDSDGYLKRIVEKPDEKTLKSLGKQVYLSMNCWWFGPKIFQACKAIKPSPRGELEITDAVSHAIEHLGERFRVLKFEAGVLDLSSRSDIAPVAKRLAGTEVVL
jgi:dTDP-glucose pyrophosphorylase